LSGNEIAKPENRHLLEIARPNGDADRWLKEKDERLAKYPWKTSYDGPSVFFGDLDPDKIHDKHPIKKFDAARIKIKLTDLLKDYPDTRMDGSELIPYTSPEVYDALDEKGKDEFVHNRHHTLSPEEIKALIARGQNPKDMWKDFKDTEGKFYASDVPHAHLITSIGKIPSKYIEFDEAQPPSKLASAQTSTSGFDDQRMHELLKTIVVDQPKGSTKDFGADYPIPTMTYPTDYGSIPGHVGEDGDDLDFFKGTGTTHGRFRVRRPDVKGGVETKFWAGLTPEEKEAVVTAFRPVIDGDPEEFSDQASLDAALARFKKEKLVRYTHGGEGTWRKTKSIMDKLPPELVGKLNVARAKFHRPDLDPTGEYESYFTEGGAKKYEDELLPLHRQALGDDIKRVEIAADDAPAVYEDDDQRIFTKKALFGGAPTESAELTPEQSVLAKIRKHLDKAGLAYHIVVENPGKGGASMHKAIGRDEGHSRAIVHAREAQVAWEKEHGYDPYEDWGDEEHKKLNK